MLSTNWLRRSFSLIFIFLVITATAGCQTSNNPDFAVSAQQNDQITQLVAAAAAKYAVPGIALGIHREGKEPVFFLQGKKSAGGEQLSLDDQFRVGSCSKNFAAMTILKLVSEGKLSLDDPLSDFQAASLLTNPNYDTSAITIRHLLMHTSGIFNYATADSFFMDYIANNLSNATPADMVAAANGHDPLFAPGAAWSYSNTNTLLLGMIIEELEGMSYAEALQSRIFTPLALNHTGLSTSATVPAGLSLTSGYIDWYNFSTGALGTQGQISDVTYINPQAMWSSGAVHSSVKDLLTWISTLMSGNFLTPEMMDVLFDDQNFTTVHNHGGILLESGLGVFRTSPYGLIGHRGQISGWDASIQAIPAKGFSIVVLCNRTLPIDYITNAQGQIIGGTVHSSEDILIYDIVKLLFPDIDTTPVSGREPLTMERVQFSFPPAPYSR